MTFLKALGILINYLPELVDLIKLIIEKTEEGIEKRTIKRKIKAINDAFRLEDRRQAAQRIDDIFRGIK